MVIFLKRIIYFLVLIFCFLFPLVKLKQDEIIIPTATLEKIYAKSIIVMEPVSKRVLYEQNIHQRLLPASITKILTCITTLENFNLDDIITITKEDINTTGSRIYLEEGDMISVEDLLYGLMLSSGNDAAKTLANHYSDNEADFIYKMNEIAKKVKMTSSSFMNSSGLDETTKNYTTAYDMALLMSYCLENPFFCKIIKTKKHTADILNSEKKLYFHNKHRLINSSEHFIGGKTGYTKLAKRTLVSAFEKQNMRIIVVSFDLGNDFYIHDHLEKYFFEKYEMKKIINLVGLVDALAQYGTFNFKMKDLYFPISKYESQNDFSITIKEINEEYIKIDYNYKFEFVNSNRLYFERGKT